MEEEKQEAHQAPQQATHGDVHSFESRQDQDPLAIAPTQTPRDASASEVGAQTQESQTPPTETEWTQMKSEPVTELDLRSLRLAQQLELATLASTSALSVAQLRELEEGGSGHFYSEAIKQQARRRVLRELGFATEAGPVAPATTALAQNKDLIQGIIRLSQGGEPITSGVSTMPSAASLQMSPIMAWFAAGIVLVIVLVWGYPFEFISTSWSQMRAWMSDSSTTVEVEAVPTLAPTPTLATPSVSESTSAQAASEALPASSSEPQPAANPAVHASVAVNPSSCAAFTAEPVTVSPAAIDKPGQYVHVESRAPIMVCISDGQGKTTQLNLTPGVGRSVYGSSPWIVSSKDWSSVDVFFQGARVWIPVNTGSRIRLIEQPISRPVTTNSVKN